MPDVVITVSLFALYAAATALLAWRAGKRTGASKAEFAIGNGE